MKDHIATRQALVNKIAALTEELTKANEELAQLDANFDVYAALATMQAQIEALAQAVLSRPVVEPSKVVEPEPEVVEPEVEDEDSEDSEDDFEENPVKAAPPAKTVPVAPAKSPSPPAKSQLPAFKNGVPKVKDSVIMVMGSGAMTCQQVVDAMLARGWLKGSKGPNAYIATIFSNNREVFLKVERGVYKVAPKFQIVGAEVDAYLKEVCAMKVPEDDGIAVNPYA
jgi:hypothetical protein